MLKLNLLFTFLVITKLVVSQTAKPPVPLKPNGCNTINGLLDSKLTDKDGVNLKYSSDLSVVYYNRKPYTGIAKECLNGKIESIETFVNGKREGASYWYTDGFLEAYRYFGKNNTEPVWQKDWREYPNGEQMLFDEGFIIEAFYYLDNRLDLHLFYNKNNKTTKIVGYDKDGLIECIMVEDMNGVIISKSGHCDGN